MIVEWYGDEAEYACLQCGHRGHSEPCERHMVQTVTSRRGGVQHIECQACGAWRDVVLEAVW